MSNTEKEYFKSMKSQMTQKDAPLALYQLSDFLYRYYNKKVIILLDEYDTPMQEAYIHGFWDELVNFTRSFFNATFKTNPWLERAIMTGITRVSKESVFSDLNNLKVITTTSDEYACCFGFTEDEVFSAMEECSLPDKKHVKKWYDGFIFGNQKDIYNPWSVINYLDTGKIAPYWTNTSSNNLVGKLIREGNKHLKTSFEALLKGKSVFVPIDEQIAYNQLADDDSSIFSLLLASGYLKVLSHEEWGDDTIFKPQYELALTNLEVTSMFHNMIHNWFQNVQGDYNDFITALLKDDIEGMNYYMNEIALTTFSFFDTEKKPSAKSSPERFYHGLVLGLIVELRDKYKITSNRESGLGRYDIMLEPLSDELDAIIIEFKVFHSQKESDLKETVANALSQIEEKNYASSLISQGICNCRIRKYGFAFKGKQVLIG